MTNSLKHLAGVAMFCIVFASAGFAQLSLGIQTGPGKSSNSGGSVGHAFGINLRYFTAPKFAVGISARLQTDKPDYYVGERKTTVTGGIMPLAVTADYFFSTGAIRPYIGGDAGVYFSGFRAKLDNNVVLQTKRRLALGAAPRVGVVFALGKVVGLQVEGVYHFMEKGNFDYKTAPANNPITGSDRFGSINAGLIIGLGHK